MKSFLYLFIFFTTITTNSQALDAYKYVMVDNQYEFQNESNEYLLNDLAIFELKKRGFDAVKSNQVQPADKNLGVCNSLALKIEAGGTLTRKITLMFEDCEGNIIFTSKQGIGRIKDNKIAYLQAMRDAMTSLDDINYSYTPEKTAPQEEVVEVPEAKIGITKSPKASIAVGENPALPKKMNAVETTLKYDYIAPNTSYKLQRDGAGFLVWKDSEMIGTLKKSDGGCFLAMTVDFVGIGYFKDDKMMIDASQNEKEVKLEFIKR
jgi:hypothetical protein